MTDDEMIGELALRLADVADIVATIETDDDGDIAEGVHTGGFLSALDYALRGSSGCIEPDEWDEQRRHALDERAEYLGLPRPHNAS